MTQNNQPQANTIRQWVAQANPTLLFKIALLFLGMVGSLFFLAWITFGDGLTKLSSTRLESGAAVSAADEIGFVAQPGLVELQIDGVNLGSVQRLDPPKQIELNGFKLDVAPQHLNENELWQTVELAANQVGWLQNSMVNYVFRLPSNRGYRDMLETAGATNGIISLTTAQGNQFDFTISEGGQRAVLGNGQLLGQKRPSITLIWMDAENSDAGYVLSGNYAPVPHLLEAFALGNQTAKIDSSDLSSANLSIKLDSVDIQSDGLQLLLRGSVTNSGISEGVIEAKEIELISNGLISQILSIDPPLPWHISPNNSQIPFTVAFQIPQEADASLTIGSQAFGLKFTQPTE